MTALEKLQALVNFWVLSPHAQAAYVTDIDWARDDCADTLAPFIADLAAEFEALRADAARYRWLRGMGLSFVHDEERRGVSTSRWGEWDYDTPEGFAARIDAAMLAAAPAGPVGAQAGGWRLMGEMTPGGVVWSGPNPHDREANPCGTRYYAAGPVEGGGNG